MNERDAYLKLCETHKVLPDQNVLKALSSASVTLALDLRGRSLTNETCEILSKLFISTTSIHNVNLSDCLLQPRGLSYLLKSLAQVSAVSHLNLKGNNISGSVIAKIGEMLKSNPSIKVLNLEWNSLGSLPDMFKEFCSGLAMNSSLQELDLQNNQLTPECATMLSDALAQNNHIKVIDLRWNEIGWQGGQHIYKALQSNNSLANVRLQGNRIPRDVAQAIEQCINHNQSRQEIIHQCAARNHILAEHVRRLETKRSLEMEGIAKQNEEIIRETEIRLNGVEEVLNERNVALANVQVELKATKAEKRTLELSYRKLQEQLQEIQLDFSLKIEEHNKDLTNLKKRALEERDKESQKLKALDILLSEEQRQRVFLEEKKATLEDDMYRLQADLTSRLETERHRHADEVAAVQKLQEERLDRIQKECDDKVREQTLDANRTHQRLNERIRSLEKNIFDLEQKLAEQSAHTAQMSQELARAAEITATAVHETKEKDLARLKLIEDRLEAARNEKTLVEKQLESAQRTVHQLQEQNNVLVLELAEPQRKIARLHEELTRERELISRLRGEMVEETTKAETRKADVDRLHMEVQKFEHQLAEAKTLSTANEREWLREREKLTSEVSIKEREIQNIRSEEAERAAALYAAITKYLGNLHPSMPFLPSRV